MPTPQVVSWQSYTKGKAKVDVSPVNPGRPFVVLSPPEKLRPYGVRAGQRMLRGEFGTREAGMCSRAVRQCFQAEGAPGLGGFWANTAKELPQSKTLLAAGYKQGDPGNIQPGDLIVYTDGNAGHVGIAVQPGGVKPRAMPPQTVKPPEAAPASLIQERLDSLGSTFTFDREPSEAAQETLAETLGIDRPRLGDFMAQADRESYLGHPKREAAMESIMPQETVQLMAQVFPEYASVIEWLFK